MRFGNLRSSALVVLVAVLLQCGMAHAEPSCAIPDVSKVDVTIEAPPPTYDRTRSRAEIVAEVRGNPPAVGDELSTLGVTGSDIEPNASIDYLSEPDGEGGWCVHLTTIYVPITWKIAVHVVSDLQPDSCMYKAVLDHEQGHVEIARRMMPRAKEIIEQAMVSVARLTVIDKTTEIGARKLQRAALDALNDGMSAVGEALEDRQRRHDSDEEYDRIRELCGAAEYERAFSWREP
jgi:hypothetical protein